MKLAIEKAIYGGAGLARVDGKAFFVPFTLPGEVVEADVSSDRGSYAEAEANTILEASPARTTPPCRYFGECGGCHYQHAEYPAQLAMKAQILRETLERAHLADIPALEILSAEPLGYRNRARFHVDRTTSQLSYKRRGSHANLPVQSCPISAPLIERALRVFQEHGNRWQLGKAFNEVELFTNAGESQLLLTFWTTSVSAAKTAVARIWSELGTHLPQAIGGALFTSEDRRQRSRLAASFGETALTYHAAGHDYRVSVGSFFQVNRHLVDRFVTLVAGDSRGQLAWDLYAGVGLFARVLQSRFDQVVAVESGPASVNDLRHNLSETRHRIVASSTADFLRRAPASSTPDLVVVDPPRAGLGKDVTGQLGQIRPAHITYVSCDPATLARDLKSLLDSGYVLDQLHMVDMFPQTFHMESVARLSLK